MIRYVKIYLCETLKSFRLAVFVSEHVCTCFYSRYDGLRQRMWSTAGAEQDCGWGRRGRGGLALAGGYPGGSF